tara:strand:+ start:6274 stop:6639 length:366 start_codon:yes stop_codon:yes gene_type:complete
MISVTKQAWKKMDTIIQKAPGAPGFLFGASGGGCNGFNFDLSVLTNDVYEKLKIKKPNSVSNGIHKVYIDPLSELYLIGTTIDYQIEDFSKGIYESKFVYEVDKKTTATCGCGVSFTPRDL